MDRKKVLIAIHYLELGGAEMSLLGLLGSFDYDNTDVDLFVYSHRGELMRFIPPQVNLLPEIPEYKQIERPIKDVIRDGYLRIALARLAAKRQYARYAAKNKPVDDGGIFSYVARRLTPVLPPVNPGTEYDVAVSYLAPHDYVLRKVRARKKVAWIHTDYSCVDVDAALELPVWSGFDSIVSISPEVTKGFLSVFPSLSDRIVERQNVVAESFIRSRAGELQQWAVEEEMPKAPGRVNLLSVGRFCRAKNYDNVPDICRRLRSKGVDAYWYLIGYGSDESLIRERIAGAGMDEYVRVLGKKENPYPYMLACDFYVQPSRYEGSPMTVLEADALGKPVIITAFPTSENVLERCRDGVEVPLDNEGCASGIASFIASRK